jgi:hypothetical protein
MISSSKSKTFDTFSVLDLNPNEKKNTFSESAVINGENGQNGRSDLITIFLEALKPRIKKFVQKPKKDLIKS